MSHDRDADPVGNDQAMTDLDAAFAALRAVPAAPPGGLVARVLADAEDVKNRTAAKRRHAERPARGLLAGLWSAVGGWGGGAGLATATLAGLAIGFGAPDVASGVTGTAVSEEAAVAAWLWPDVGLVIDGLSAAEEG